MDMTETTQPHVACYPIVTEPKGLTEEGVRELHNALDETIAAMKVACEQNDYPLDGVFVGEWECHLLYGADGVAAIAANQEVQEVELEGELDNIRQFVPPPDSPVQ